MIGCKVMRTLASVEIETVLILGLPCCLSSSSVRCLESSQRMSTPVFVDPESSTQADGAQSSRVPVSLPADPYEAIRQAYLDGTNTKDDSYDEEIEESMDSDSVSEDAEDEGPTTEDKDPAAEDRVYYGGSRCPDDEGHSVESDGLGLEEEEAASGGQQHAAPVVGTVVSAPLGLGYHLHPEWTSGSLSISPSHSDVPSPISSPMIPLTVPSPIATPAVVETEGFLTELRAQRFGRWQGGRDSRSCSTLERSYRLLCLRGTVRTKESYSLGRGRLGRRFSPRGMLGEPGILRLQLAEERRARLELVEVVDGMRRGQEPKGAQFCPCVSALRLVARDRADTHFLIRMWREI
ncbi:hypothetical protein Tco_0204089 [Tanacetum coccineum]